MSLNICKRQVRLKWSKPSYTAEWKLLWIIAIDRCTVLQHLIICRSGYPNHRVNRNINPASEVLPLSTTVIIGLNYLHLWNYVSCMKSDLVKIHCNTIKGYAYKQIICIMFSFTTYCNYFILLTYYIFLLFVFHTKLHLMRNEKQLSKEQELNFVFICY